MLRNWWCSITSPRIGGRDEVLLMQHRPGRPRLPRSLFVCAAMLLASCQQAGILDPQGPVASAQRLILINSTAIMLPVVVPVILMALGFAWWYRSSNVRARR